MILAPRTVFVLLSILSAGFASEEIDDTANHAKSRTEHERALGLFQIVRFPNDPCISADTSKNGTCYTSEECSAKGGASQGTCASGYGVCCTFSINCGGKSSENCTYFQSTSGVVGECRVKICKCDTNICQLRLDFNQFVITGPSTGTLTLSVLNGQASNEATGVASTYESQCLTDTFGVSSATGQAPPSICGINNGQHMYVDADENCNDLTFTLGNTAQGVGALATRQWDIKVTQYSCDYNNLAPEGCTQYFFGSNSQAVQTYNFDGGQHLANQRQNICVRRENTNCRICWAAAAVTDVGTNLAAAMGSFSVLDAFCCAHDMTAMGFDCVVIPGALTTMMNTMQMNTQLCGNGKGLGVGISSADATVCSNRQPFSIQFLSDAFETMAETAGLVKNGFKLSYIQSSTGC